MATKKAVVDGSNVAYEETTGDGKPRVANIVGMRQALMRLGYSPTIIVDATLRHEIDDPVQLEGLMENGTIHQAPANTDADYFVIETAEREGGVVVSNDMFERYREENPWLDERRVPYMIVNGELQLHLPDLA